MRTTLLVASVLFACLASASERDALAMIERRGGTVEGSPVTKVDLHESAVTDDELALLTAFPELKHLDLRKTTVTDAGVAHLAPLKKLQLLNLFRTNLTDAGLSSLVHLSAVRSLRVLLIGRSSITPEGAARLQAVNPELKFTAM